MYQIKRIRGRTAEGMLHLVPMGPFDVALVLALGFRSCSRQCRIRGDRCGNRERRKLIAGHRETIGRPESQRIELPIKGGPDNYVGSGSSASGTFHSSRPTCSMIPSLLSRTR